MDRLNNRFNWDDSEAHKNNYVKNVSALYVDYKGSTSGGPDSVGKDEYFDLDRVKKALCPLFPLESEFSEALLDAIKLGHLSLLDAFFISLSAKVLKKRFLESQAALLDEENAMPYGGEASQKKNTISVAVLIEEFNKVINQYCVPENFDKPYQSDPHKDSIKVLKTRKATLNRVAHAATIAVVMGVLLTFVITALLIPAFHPLVLLGIGGIIGIALGALAVGTIVDRLWVFGNTKNCTKKVKNCKERQKVAQQQEKQGQNQNRDEASKKLLGSTQKFWLHGLLAENKISNPNDRKVLQKKIDVALGLNPESNSINL